MKFRKGDVVRVRDTASIRFWYNWKQAVGQVGTITYAKSGTYFLDGNRYGINFKEYDLELVTMSTGNRAYSENNS